MSTASPDRKLWDISGWHEGVWVKALLGLSMFEATLGIIGSKANYAAGIARKMAAIIEH